MSELKHQNFAYFYWKIQNRTAMEDKKIIQILCLNFQRFNEKSPILCKRVNAACNLQKFQPSNYSGSIPTLKFNYHLWIFFCNCL